jgi:hypothetical protein
VEVGVIVGVWVMLGVGIIFGVGVDVTCVAPFAVPGFPAVCATPVPVGISVQDIVRSNNPTQTVFLYRSKTVISTFSPSLFFYLFSKRIGRPGGF